MINSLTGRIDVSNNKFIYHNNNLIINDITFVDKWQVIYDLLHLWHFDMRGLIKEGEAINVNTLNINPYST